MEILIGWLVFSVVVGVLAHGRGRSGIGWSAIAALISPLLAGILLFVMADLKRENEQVQRQQAAQAEASRVAGPDFVLQLEALRQLHAKKVLTDVEFTGRKANLISGLRGRGFVDGPEHFLGALLPLLENGGLSTRELDEIKSIAFANETEPAVSTTAASSEPGI